MKPASGTISVNGRVFRSDDPCIDLPVESRGIGFVFQSHRLFPHLTVRKNLLFGRRLGGRRTAVDQERLIEVLGIAHLLSRGPDTLSGGESQRVALGRGILAAETLLIMDEPLASLDSERKAELLGYFERIPEITGIPVQKSFGGNIGQMLAQVKHGSGVNVVISDEASLEKFHDALAPDARRLGDTPLVLVWRKELELKRPEDIAFESVKTVASPNLKAAVYGRSAAEWLKATGLDAKVAPKLQVVGTVPHGLLLRDDGQHGRRLREPCRTQVRHGGTRRPHGHPRRKRRRTQTVRPVRGAEADTDVKAFMDFLASEKVKPLLRKFGIE